MSEQTAVGKREVWVDDVKVIACVLVVLGHFFQSMTKAGIVPAGNLYEWFNTTIYYFHVPLFFICSGYLNQKYSKVNSFKSWKKNVLKKALALGVPYVTFTTATWVLKKVFSSNVNDQIGGLGDTLLLHAHAVCGSTALRVAEDWNFKCCGACAVGTWNQFCGADNCSVGYEENKVVGVFPVSE